jgi:hypothetical protein
MRNKLAAVVVATVALLTVSGTASASTIAEPIGYGYTDLPVAVKCVQHDINYFSIAQGGWHPQIAEDGSFGPETYSAVVWFQNRLISDAKYADGIVGPLTGDLLMSYGDPNTAMPCSPFVPTLRF